MIEFRRYERPEKKKFFERVALCGPRLRMISVEAGGGRSLQEFAGACRVSGPQESRLIGLISISSCWFFHVLQVGFTSATGLMIRQGASLKVKE